MSGGLDATSDASTGAAVGQAVEPAQREATAGGHGPAQGGCLNCGSPLAGPYCHDCGQASHVHRTLTALWHDIAHGVFHFEGKVWRTIPMLAWRPGELTRRYIHGERARFVSPLALFLFSVFVMFAVFESVGGPFVPSNTHDRAKKAPVSLPAELAKTKAKIVDLERQRAAATKAGRPVAGLDAKLDNAREKATEISEAMTLTGAAKADIKPEGDRPPIVVDLGPKEVNERIKQGLENPKLLIYKLQSSAHKFSWSLIPLSLPFMWAMFAWRREYKLYDHAVFVTYSIAFVMLLLVAMALIATTGIPTAWMLVLVPVHFFRQLQQAYQLSVRSALWRTVALLIVAVITLTVFGALLLVMGLAE